MKRTLSALIVSVIMVCLVGGCCPKNPPINSAISAHGNTDWHVDTANEFLFGTDMGGNNTAPNHCPDTWTRRHMHVGLTNTSHFYYDKSRIATGDDADATSGIDQAMLFFYAGHGWPLDFDTLGNAAAMGNMILGNCPGSGLLRYYWQCSCEVFAHGPRNCSAGGLEYSCPGDFTWQNDSLAMRNVYQRWGPALTKDLRMACGSSTSAWCHEGNVNRIWDRYNNMGFDVADSFIDGLATATPAVPLCITMGGVDVTATPLYDAVFTNQPNTSGTSYYHIQWMSNFASSPRMAMVVPRLPELLPILELIPRPIPEQYRRQGLMEKGGLLVSKEEPGPGGYAVRYNPASGALYLRGQTSKAQMKSAALPEGRYLEQAKQILQISGLVQEEVAEPTGYRIMLSSQPVKGGEQAITKMQKKVVVNFQRVITVDGQKVNILGDGGVLTVQLNNDGSLANAALVGRTVARAKSTAKVKKYDQAYEEALQKIKDPAKYKLLSWNWGYKELAGNVKQSEMRVVFIFTFMPRNAELQRNYPPMQIEIPGFVR